MKKKKIISYMLGAAILVGSTVTAFASEDTAIVLTIEEAMTQAKDVSRTLKASDRNVSYQSNVLDMALLMSDYSMYKNAQTSYEYSKRLDELMNDTIEFSVNQSFDTIISLEKEIALNEKKIELGEQDLKRYEIMYENGLVTEVQLEGVKLAQSQLITNQEKLEKDLANQYTELNILLGTRNKEYTLEKDPIEYEVYNYDGTVDALVKRASRNHIELWLAEEQLNNMKYNRPSSNQLLYLEHKNNEEAARDRVKDVEEQIQASAREIYTTLIQLENQYEILVKNIEIKEKQIAINKVNLENGLISQLEYEQSVLEYEESLFELEKLVINHSYLKQQLNNPNMIGVASSQF